MSDQQQLEKAIVEALETVSEPDGRNVIEAEVVTGVGIGDQEQLLRVSCRNPGWPEPICQRLEREIRTALQAKLPQFERIELAWELAGAAEQGADQERESGSAQVKHVIAIGSGKGGVGKSTIAASLAYALKHRGKTVGLMDADVYGPSIPHMLGLSGQPGAHGNRFVPPECDGIKVISMGFLAPANQAVVWRGPMLHKAVSDFLHAVEWGELDVLIVDMPPGTGDVALSLSQQTPLAGGVIVCTPQDVALLDARKALSMFGTVKIPCRGIVENMSFFECPGCGARTEIFGHGGAKAWAEEAGVPFLGSVPINLQIRLNGDQGHLRDNFADDNPVRENLLQIADRLMEDLDTETGPAAPTLEVIG